MEWGEYEDTDKLPILPRTLSQYPPRPILTALGAIGAPRAIGSLVGLAEEANAAGVGTGLASGILREAWEARPGAAGIRAEGVEAGAEVPATAETTRTGRDTRTSREYTDGTAECVRYLGSCR
jgi:hypothetical protein